MESIKKYIMLTALLGAIVPVGRICAAAQEGAAEEEVKEAATGEREFISALLEALENGDDGALKQLIAQIGSTPLLALFQAVDTDQVYLLSKLLNNEYVKTLVPHMSSSVLYRAVGRGSVDIGALALAQGANINAWIVTPTGEEETPLMLASRKGYIEIARLLLERGAIVGEHCSRGESALTIAVDTGNMEMVELLLKSEMDRLVRIYGNLENGVGDNTYFILTYRALLRAAEKGNAKIATRLLYASPMLRGVSALAKAVKGGHEDVVRTLILANVPYNGKVFDGSSVTPWSIASDDMKQVIVEALRENVSSGLVNYLLLDGDAQEVGELWTQMPASVKNLTAEYAAALFSEEDYERMDR